MRQWYKGKLGCFEYDDDEVEIIQSKNILKWKGTSNSVTLKGVLYSIKEMFKDTSIPEGFTLDLNVRELNSALHCFEGCHIPEKFTLNINTDRECTFYGMFHSTVIEDDFNIKITGNYTHCLAYMFCNSNIKGDFNLDIPFNYVGDVAGMFAGVVFGKKFDLCFDLSRTSDSGCLFAQVKFPQGSHLKIVGGLLDRVSYMFECSEITPGTEIDMTEVYPRICKGMFSEAQIYEGADIKLNLSVAEEAEEMFICTRFYGRHNLELLVPTTIKTTCAFTGSEIPDDCEVKFKLLNADILPADYVKYYEDKISEEANKDLEYSNYEPEGYSEPCLTSVPANSTSKLFDVNAIPSNFGFDLSDMTI